MRLLYSRYGTWFLWFIKQHSYIVWETILENYQYKIDCGKDNLSMQVGDEMIEFNFYDGMKYP